MDPRIVRAREVQELLGIGKTTLWRWKNDPALKFPKAIRLGARAVGWHAEEIEQWIRSRPAA